MNFVVASEDLFLTYMAALIVAWVGIDNSAVILIFWHPDGVKHYYSYMHLPTWGVEWRRCYSSGIYILILLQFLTRKSPLVWINLSASRPSPYRRSSFGKHVTVHLILKILLGRIPVPLKWFIFYQNYKFYCNKKFLLSRYWSNFFFFVDYVDIQASIGLLMNSIHFVLWRLEPGNCLASEEIEMDCLSCIASNG